MLHPSFEFFQVELRIYLRLALHVCALWPQDRTLCDRIYYVSVEGGGGGVGV